MKKIIFSFLILVTPLTINFGQITISQSDYRQLFLIGDSYVAGADTVNEEFDIGNEGGNNSWDFSSIAPSPVLTIENVTASSTPYASYFTGSTVASQYSVEADLDDTSTVKYSVWDYYSANEMVMDFGIAAEIILTTTNTQLISSNIRTQNIPFQKYQFPMQYNSSWSVSDSATAETVLNGVTSSIEHIKTTRDYFIDAWGTLKLPSGKTIDVLRTKEVRTEIVTSDSDIDTSKSVAFIFSRNSAEVVIITADSESPNTSGVILGNAQFVDNGITEVEKLETVPHKFLLMQNYPNPFNPTTSIQYSITKPSFVKLQVYDILGNKVAELVNKFQSIGNYKISFDGSNLTSGVYLIQLQAGDQIDIKKMTLMK